MKINKPKRYYLKTTTIYYQDWIEVDFVDMNKHSYWYKIEYRLKN